MLKMCPFFARMLRSGPCIFCLGDRGEIVPGRTDGVRFDLAGSAFIRLTLALVALGLGG